MVVLHNLSGQLPELPGVTVTELTTPTTTVGVELSFDFHVDGPALRGTVEYNTDLFDADTIERLSGLLLALLHGRAEEPHRPVGDLPLLDAPQLDRLLRDWHPTDLNTADTTFAELFEQQVRATPRADALVCAGERLSYVELNEQANRLAHHLIAQGVGTEDVVAVALPRSVPAIVAVLAVAKAG